MLEKVTVRDLKPEDDFGLISDLIQATLERSVRELNVRMCYNRNPERLKNSFFPKDNENAQTLYPPSKGFVAESGGKIVAMMSVSFSDQSANGFVLTGYDEQHEATLASLLPLCEQTIHENGGTRLYKFVQAAPGEIRNAELARWEKLGFVSDRHFHALVKMDLDEWNLPHDLDLSVVTPGNKEQFEEIEQLLREDGEDVLAEEFSEEFAEWTPDKVLLLLRKHDSDEIAAFSYYRVAAFKDKSRAGKAYDGLGAWGVGFHFRPHLVRSRKEKKAFIQCTLASMKQLNVIFTSSRISSRDFDALIEMFAEGFYFQGDNPCVDVRLGKASTRMSKYVNANHVLPEHLVKEIQQYVQGQHLYIPRVERKAWGTETGIREELKRRNNEIARMYKDGIDMVKLAELFSLSVERIEAIVYSEQLD